jgi:hypothetical protein
MFRGGPVGEVDGGGSDAKGEVEGVAEAIGEEEFGRRETDVVFRDAQNLWP